MNFLKCVLVVLFVCGVLIGTLLGDGHVETLVPFDIDANELTEGVAIDADGNIYVSVSPLGAVVKLAAGSDTVEPFGVVEGLAEGDIGLLGLAVSEAGDVYGALSSSNPDVNGVWVFDGMTGEVERVPGSEAILLPNAVAFDADGVMYITDTVMGAVWTVEAGGSAEVWIQDPLLEGDESIGFGIPIGANGIDVADDTVYVGSMEATTIVAIPILDDGTAGEASVWATLPEGNYVDGIALDNDGNIYVVTPTTNTVFLAHADGTLDTVATEADGVDAPASVIYVEDGDAAAIYIANFSIAVNPPGGAGPSLMRISVGDHSTD